MRASVCVCACVCMCGFQKLYEDMGSDTATRKIDERTSQPYMERSVPGLHCTEKENDSDLAGEESGGKVYSCYLKHEITFEELKNIYVTTLLDVDPTKTYDNQMVMVKGYGDWDFRQEFSTTTEGVTNFTGYRFQQGHFRINRPKPPGVSR